MTRRPRSHVLEDQSRNRLRRLFTDVGWTVQDIQQDYGEDLLVRIFEDGEATPYYFLVQVKATDDLGRFRTALGNLVIQVPNTTARTWRDLSQPLFLILWSASTDELYWCHVQTFFQSQANKKRLDAGRKSIRIPVTNRLTIDDLPALTGIVREVTTWTTKAYESLQLLKQQHSETKLVIFGSAALTDASDATGDRMVIIDEVETSLHPAAAQSMLALLRDPNLKIGLRLTDLSGNVLHWSNYSASGVLLHEVLHNCLEPKLPEKLRNAGRVKRNRRKEKAAGDGLNE